MNHSLQHVPVDISDSLWVVHWGNSIDCFFTRWSLHNLVDHRAPEILDFMSPSNPIVPQVNHLANWEMCLPDSLVMPLFPAASISQQPFTSTLESNSESGLVFDHPVLYPTRYRLLDSTQEKVYRKLRFLSKHQIER
ncbi:hypothetical protein NQZ68_029823 [Dissostichus eleginoides]|nr:hypothetical protein NQZ68_029823 [Dissostichus eleginoides]